MLFLISFAYDGKCCEREREGTKYTRRKKTRLMKRACVGSVWF